MNKRVLLFVLDSAGIGALPDAALYGDEGANTIGHIAEKVDLRLPNMASMGLSHIEGSNMAKGPGAIGAFGRMAEVSPGKDTTTGHWEMAGVQLSQPFPTYPNGFPGEVLEAFEQAVGTKTIGNCVASGTVIINELGEEHVRTGYPIVYTSADSVFQIACHEALYAPEKLYEFCRIARKILSGKHAVGRVIARPFIGDSEHGFTRTPRRHDFSLKPLGRTVLDALKEAGRDVIAVGKIDDIFAGEGITLGDHAAGNPACIEAAKKYMGQAFNGLCFVNLVDTDMIYGHRRDAQGYANALMAFDQELPAFLDRMGEEDLLLITADHGCDPTYRGTDHTREYVPVLMYSRKQKKLTNLGTRTTFADLAATIAEYFDLQDRFGAVSFLKEGLQ